MSKVINIHESEIHERFSQYYSNDSKAKHYVVLTFVSGLILQSFEYYVTKGLSLIEYISVNPEHEFLLVANGILSMILIVVSIFGFLLVFITNETERYYKIAEEKCIKFSKDNQDGKLLQDKIDEEIKWVRDNIARAPF